MATDRRVKYTKRVLGDSLIELLNEKPISRITIKEICARADINRTTYYAHYSDQYDQLKQLADGCIDEIKKHMASYVLEDGENDLVKFVDQILDYVQDNAEMIRVLLGKNGTIDFQEQIIAIIGGYILEEWKNKTSLSPDDAEYIYVYVASGCFGILKRWLFAENAKVSSLEIAEYCVKLSSSGIEKFIR